MKAIILLNFTVFTNRKDPDELQLVKVQWLLDLQEQQKQLKDEVTALKSEMKEKDLLLKEKEGIIRDKERAIQKSERYTHSNMEHIVYII